MTPVVIIGGVLNSKLKRWIKELDITEFKHIELTITDISPYNLTEVSERLCSTLSAVNPIISVGTLADAILKKYFVVHGALPGIHTKDKKEIKKTLEACRNYLIQRRYYVNNTSNSKPS